MPACRYHGDRAAVGEGCWEGYQQALVRAWRGSGELPFLLDNVWDLLRLLDLLQSRWAGGARAAAHGRQAVLGIP